MILFCTINGHKNGRKSKISYCTIMINTKQKIKIDNICTVLITGKSYDIAEYFILHISKINCKF